MTQAAAGRGRLTAEREAELYGHVIDLVREVGYDSLTMDAVAARARTSKATLYRQWSGKPQLVAAAMRHTRSHLLVDADTGSLRGDLHAVADVAAGTLEEDTVFMSAVGHAANQNPDLGAALREMLVEPLRQVLRAMLARAVARGEVREGAAAGEFLPHVLVGALPARKMLDDRFPDPEYMKAYIDAVVLPALRNS